MVKVGYGLARVRVVEKAIAERGEVGRNLDRRDDDR